MVKLRPLSSPTQGIALKEENTSVHLNGGCIGNGTMYIGHSCLTWVSNNGEGFTLNYPAMSLHAVSRDTTSFPHHCLYVMVDASLADSFDNDRAGSEDEDDESADVRELRFVPSDPAQLDGMFSAMSDCQALHPDPEDSFSDEENPWAGGDDEENEAGEAGPGYEAVTDAALTSGQFFTDESGLQHLTAEGRANLTRLMTAMSIQPPGGAGDPAAHANGNAAPEQFEDAEDMDEA